MDSRINALFRRYALALMLLEVFLTSVYLAPIDNSADYLETTKNLAELQRKESEQLLKSYEARYGSYSNSTPEDVPNPTVSGVDFLNKLKDIYTKNKLFQLHFEKFEVYLAELSEQPFEEQLTTDVRKRFEQISYCLNSGISTLEPNTPLPAEPAALQITHEHDYNKKKYSWHVLDGLKTWLSQVVEVLENGK